MPAPVLNALADYAFNTLLPTVQDNNGPQQSVGGDPNNPTAAVAAYKADPMYSQNRVAKGGYG